jgi:hypothetical protein
MDGDKRICRVTKIGLTNMRVIIIFNVRKCFTLHEKQAMYQAGFNFTLRSLQQYS